MFVVGTLSHVAQRFEGLRVRWQERRSRRSYLAPKTWWRYPDIADGNEISLFVAFTPDGRFSEHSLIHARAWAARGFQVILIAVTNDPSNFQATGDDDLSFAAGILVRENAGHDFGAWAAAIVDLLPELRRSPLVVAVNDSLYGPLGGFDLLIERARGVAADVVGAVESLQFAPHFQSYLIFYKSGALQSAAFARFWRNVRDVPKGIVIRRYELGLRLRMQRAGLRCIPLFPVEPGDPVNPTLFAWRTMLARGFPFVKVTTIRADPGGEAIAGWPAVFEADGYDPHVVYRHLGISEASQLNKAT